MPSTSSEPSSTGPGGATSPSKSTMIPSVPIPPRAPAPLFDAASAIPICQPLVQLTIAPLEDFLSSFRSAVVAQFAHLSQELRDAKQTIAELQEKINTVNGKVLGTESLTLNHATAHLSKQTFQQAMGKLAKHLNEMDPMYEPGQTGPADWLNTVVVLDAPSPTSSQSGAQKGGRQVTSVQGGSRPTFGSQPVSHRGSTHSTALPPSQPPPPLDAFAVADGNGSVSSTSSVQSVPLTGVPSGGQQASGSVGSPVDLTKRRQSLSAPGDPKMRNFVRCEIAQWYEDTGKEEAEAAHQRTMEQVNKLIGSMREIVNDKMSLSSCTGWFDTMRGEMRAMKDEEGSMKKSILQSEARVLAALEDAKRQSAAGERALSSRVSQVYDVFGMVEPTISSDAFTRSAGSAQGDDGRQQQQDVTNTTATAGGGDPATYAIGSPEEQLWQQDYDPKTLAVLKSTAFIALRQMVLDDIIERVSSSRQSSSSDVGLEILALRNDIRQRVTAQKVVEIIKDHVNVAAINQKIDGVLQKVVAFDNETVKTGEFIDALKTKADLSQLQMRISRQEFEAHVSDEAAERRRQDSEMKVLMDEREEIRSVFKDAVHFHKREMLKGGRQAPEWKEGSPIVTTEYDDDANDHLQRILQGGDKRAVSSQQSHRPEAMTADSAASRQTPSTSRQGTRRVGAPLKPITESKTQSQNITPFPPQSTTKGPSPSPQGTLKPMGSRMPPYPTATSGGASSLIPLTTNQELYAKHVAEELIKAQIEALPCLPYERSAPPR